MSPPERDELEKRFEEARASRAAARASAPDDAAANDLPPMQSGDEVLVELQSISKELRESNAACIEKFAPGVKTFETKLTLIGDPDIGTLIDASTPVVDENGAPLPSKFDDCVRDGLQSLALPPTTNGDEYTVTMTFERS